MEQAGWKTFLLGIRDGHVRFVAQQIRWTINDNVWCEAGLRKLSRFYDALATVVAPRDNNSVRFLRTVIFHQKITRSGQERRPEHPDCSGDGCQKENRI